MFGPSLVLVMMISAAPTPAPPVGEVFERLTDALNAADPAVRRTGKLLPVADLAAASEVAEEQLKRGDLRANDVAVLSDLAHEARSLAYARSGDPRHLCRDVALLQTSLVSPASDAAIRQRHTANLTRTRQVLSTSHPEHVCEDVSPLMPVLRSSSLVRPRVAQASDQPRSAAKTREQGLGAQAAGGVLLGLAGGMIGGLIATLDWRANIRGEVLELRAEIRDNGSLRTLAQEEERLRLGRLVRTSDALLASFSVGAAVLAATGVALVVTGTRKRARARVTPYGDLAGGGLVLRASF